MKKPSYRKYHLSDEVFRLLEIENTDNTDNTDEKLKIINNLRKQKETRMAMIVGTALTIVLICLSSYLFYKLAHPNWIIVLLCLSWFLWGLMWNVVEAIIKKFHSQDTLAIITQYYQSEISQADRTNYKDYEADIITFYATPTKITWEDIILKDGEVDFIIKIFENQYTKIEVESESIYEDYKVLVIDQLPDVYVYVKDNIVSVYNEDDFYYGIKLIKERYKKDREILERYGSANQSGIIAGIQNRKSKFLNILLERQVKGLGIIKDKEIIEHNSSRGLVETEPAYIFTLLSNKTNHYIVVFENVNDGRTSIICDIEIQDYSNYITTLVSYMGRQRIINKRDFLRSSKQIKEYEIRFANHNNPEAWERNVKNISLVTRRYRTYTFRQKKYSYKKRRRWYRR